MTEIIPAIDIIDGKVVRLTKGDYSLKTVYERDPVAAAMTFEQHGCRRLHMVDLDGAKAGRPVNTNIIEAVCSATNLHVDVGGGIRRDEDVALLLSAGVKQITAGSVAVRDRALVLGWIDKFGPEVIILGADIKDGRIAVSGWQETVDSGVEEFIASYAEAGIRTVICTDVGRDGTFQGPALQTYKELMKRFPDIEIVASGGVGTLKDIEALRRAGVRSVIVGKALYENRITLEEAMVAGGTIEGCAVRIIPCLDVKGGRVVKGTNFVNLRDAGDPVELASRYSEEGADELVFLDISATDEQRKTVADMVRSVAQAVNIPFTVGGGISSVEDASLLLTNGADKVSVNSAAVRDPELISRLAERFGSQCVVLAVDAARESDGNWQIYVNGGKVPTGIDLFEWVERGVSLGAGEILFTAINNDGTGKGYANDALARIASLVKVPLIASGGAGAPEHFAEAALEGRATGVLAASLFHYGKLRIGDLKEYLHQRGIKVRPS